MAKKLTSYLFQKIIAIAIVFILAFLIYSLVPYQSGGTDIFDYIFYILLFFIIIGALGSKKGVYISFLLGLFLGLLGFVIALLLQGNCAGPVQNCGILAFIFLAVPLLLPIFVGVLTGWAIDKGLDLILPSIESGTEDEINEEKVNSKDTENTDLDSLVKLNPED